MFDVVKFPPDSDIEDDVETVEVVPHSWIKYQNGETKCSWPKSKNILQLITSLKPAPDSWKKVSATVLNKEPIRSYELAIAKRNNALENSDLSAIDDSPMPNRKRNIRPPDFFHDELQNSPPHTSKKARRAHQTPSFELVVPELESHGLGTFSDPNEAKITFPDTQDYEIQEVLTFDVPQNKEFEEIAENMSSIKSTLSELRQNQIWLKMTVGNLDAKLNLLASNMSLLQAPIPIAEDVLKAPFDEITAFLTFESEIKASKDMADLLKTQFTFVGGSGVSDCVNKIMKKVMTPQLASQYSQFGLGNNNKNFSNTSVYKVILDSLRSSQKNKEAEINKALVEWFRRTGERLKALNVKRSRNGRDGE